MAVTPSIPGIRRSMRTTSGRNSRAMRMASRPSPACPRIVMASSWPTIVDTALRANGSSSARRTVTTQCMVLQELPRQASQGQEALRHGIVTVTENIPFSSVRHTVPSSNLTRSLMPESPRPEPSPRTPSTIGFEHSMRTPSAGEACTLRAAVVPGAWLAVFVSSSWTVRYTARERAGSAESPSET